jgi:Na+-transporting NADH:ubiquinone oxidoreductase subunit NqrB
MGWSCVPAAWKVQLLAAIAFRTTGSTEGACVCLAYRNTFVTDLPAGLYNMPLIAVSSDTR